MIEDGGVVFEEVLVLDQTWKKPVTSRLIMVASLKVQVRMSVMSLL